MTSNDHSTALAEGALLQGGRYSIERVLGQDAFGITYLGTQVALRRQVAIKEFFMQDCCERDGSTSAVSVASTGLREIVARFRDKFIKVVQLIAGLDHPHIIRIYDFFQEHDTAYYVMEHIAGGSLSDLVARRGYLDEATALGYIRQMGDALTYLHRQNILHLDVKPSNVLLRPSGEVVLIDFGISKRYDEAGGQTSTTSADISRGYAPIEQYPQSGISKGYAPLEQYRQGGTSQFSPATDVYSLGATLYKLLTGQTPPESMDLLSVPLTFPPHVNPTLRSVIVRSMQPVRGERYQSVQEMIAALAAYDDADKKHATTGTAPQDEAAMEVTVISGPDGPWPQHAPQPSLRSSSTGEQPQQKPQQQARQQAQRQPTPQQSQARPSAPYPQPALKPDSVAPQATSGTDKQSVSGAAERPASGAAAKRTSGRSSTAWVVVAACAVVALIVWGLSSRSGGGSESEGASTSSGEAISTSSNSSPTAITTDSNTINGHAYVDLGLSVKWATCNVGANSPSDYGNHYAWGEISTKSTYTEDNSKTYLKDAYNRDIGGDASLDAARANWGATWRLPTEAEFQELLNNCTWTWTKQSGHNGYKVTNKKKGYEGRSIFLPAAGWRYGSSLNYAGEDGYCWSSSPRGSNSYRARYLYFGCSNDYTYWNYRYFGFSVRPVSE